jgi:hypothetical protein
MAGVEAAERALELADEAIARADVEGAVAHLSGAIRGFTAADEKRRAAMACLRLGDTMANAMGNLTASRAWFARARRLVEADECGSVNMWLTAAPDSQVAHGALGCDVSLDDLCDRPPRALDEGELIDLGGKRLRQISTPHVPHGWEAQVLYEETTGTLLCGDLFSQIGAGPPVTTDDVVEPALAAERLFHASSLAPHTAGTLRQLGDLSPTTLAIMHGTSFRGDGKAALYDLATGYEELIAAG